MVRVALLYAVLCGFLANNALAQTTPLPNFNTPRPNFAGAWEKDFSRSDKWEDELTRQLDQLRRDAERGIPSGDMRTQSPLLIGGSRSGGRGANIVELGQLAGYIHRQTTMRIYQSAVEVRLQREGDADLVCSTVEASGAATYTSEFGQELCGWDGLQLVFRITLPEGVEIQHRISVSSDRRELNMATTLSSRGSVPFNMLQFFRRYDSPNEDFTCVQTISRGNSCSLRDTPLDR